MKIATCWYTRAVWQGKRHRHMFTEPLCPLISHQIMKCYNEVLGSFCNVFFSSVLASLSWKCKRNFKYKSPEIKIGRDKLCGVTRETIFQTSKHFVVDIEGEDWPACIKLPDKQTFLKKAKEKKKAAAEKLTFLARAAMKARRNLWRKNSSIYNSPSHSHSLQFISVCSCGAKILATTQRIFLPSFLVKDRSISCLLSGPFFPFSGTLKLSIHVNYAIARRSDASVARF